MRVYEETDCLLTGQAFSNALDWVANRKAQHIIGDKLPRGKRFDYDRDSFENKYQSSIIGKVILSDLRSAISSSCK